MAPVETWVYIIAEVGSYVASLYANEGTNPKTVFVHRINYIV